MRADLEIDQCQRFEGSRLDDGHVLGRLQRRSGDDGPGAGTHVGQALGDPAANRRDELHILKALQQPKGISASDEQGLGSLELVAAGESFELVSHRLQPGASLGAVRLPVEQGERREEHAPCPADQAPQLGVHVVQIAAAVLGRVADQQESLHRTPPPRKIRPAAPAASISTGSGTLRALTRTSSATAAMAAVGTSKMARLPRTKAAPAIAPVAAAVTPSTKDLICGTRAQRR